MTTITKEIIATCFALKARYDAAYDRAAKEWETRERKRHGDNLLEYDYTFCPESLETIQGLYEETISAIAETANCGRGAAWSFLDGYPESILGGYKVWTDSGWSCYYGHDNVENALRQFMTLRKEESSPHIAVVEIDFPTLGPDKYLHFDHGTLRLASTKSLNV